MREIVGREAFGISPWPPSIIRASVRCTRRGSGQRRLRPSGKGPGDVAPGSVTTPGGMRWDGAEVRGERAKDAGVMVPSVPS